MILNKTHLFAGLIATSFLFLSTTNPANSYDRDFNQRFKYKQSQHRYKMQEMKRKHEQRKKEFQERREANRYSSSSQPSSYSRSSRPSSTPSTRRRASTSSSQQRLVYKSVTNAQKAFTAKSAPRPDMCFLKFVQASKGASSMGQIYPYLPSNKVVKIKQGLGDSLDKNSYLNKKANYYRTLASNVVEVVDYKILPKDKDKGYTLAKLEVKMLNTSARTGKSYKYRNDIIKMIGEGNYWKFNSRRKSSIVHNGKPPKGLRD